MSEDHNHQPSTQPTGEAPLRRSALEKMVDEAQDRDPRTAGPVHTAPTEGFAANADPAGGYGADAGGYGQGANATQPIQAAQQQVQAARQATAQYPEQGQAPVAPAPVAGAPAGVAGAPAAAPRPRRSGGIRRIKMTLSHIEPLSALKLGFLTAVALGVMIVAAMAIIWFVLDGMHVFAQLNELLVTLNSETLLKLAQYLEFSRWMSFAVIIAIVDVVLLTVFSVIGALVYNLIAALVGGVKVTLSDE